MICTADKLGNYQYVQKIHMKYYSITVCIYRYIAIRHSIISYKFNIHQEKGHKYNTVYFQFHNLLVFKAGL